MVRRFIEMLVVWGQESWTSDGWRKLGARVDLRCRYFPFPQPRSIPILPDGKVERKAGINGHGWQRSKGRKERRKKQLRQRWAGEASASPVLLPCIWCERNEKLSLDKRCWEARWSECSVRRRGEILTDQPALTHVHSAVRKPLRRMMFPDLFLASLTSVQKV